MRRSRKTSRGGRFLAIVLAMSMVLQQAGISSLAEDGTTLAAETTVTEATTEAAESNSEDTSNETTAAADSSSTTTDAVSTEASTTTDTAADTDAADTSDADVTADESTDPSVSSDSETTLDISIEETDSNETTTEDGSEESTEAVTEAAAKAESESEAETEDATEAAAEAADAETEAATEAEDETEVEEPKTSFTYSDSSVVITATAAEEANFSQDTELMAEYIEPDSEEYAAAYLAAVSAIETQLGTQLGIDEENTQTAYVLYDVYFVCDGERVEPEAGSVNVSMVFRQAVELGLEGEITNKAVVHLQDSGVAEIVTDFVNINADGDMTAMSFTQSSFSYTGAVVTGETSADEEETEEGTEVVTEAEEETEAAVEAEEETEAVAENEEETEAAVEAEEETETESETEAAVLLGSTAESTTDSFTSDNGTISASVQLSDGVLPESVQLVVETADGSTYEDAADLAISCAADAGITFSDYTVLDIHLEDTEGTEIDYSGSATVTLSFATPILDGDESTEALVFHINDGEAEYLAPDTDYTDSTTGVISGITFTTTSGFSPYVIALGSYGIMAASTATLDSDGNVALEDIASSITATVESSTEDVSRSGALKIAISYNIDDDELDVAKAATAWTYDLTSLLTDTNASAIFSSVYKNGSGFIFNGSTNVGSYTIVDGIIYLYIKNSWLSQQDSSVNGTFDFYCSFDSSSIGTDSEETFEFPGTGEPITVKFEDVDVETSKTVNSKSGDAGNYLMNADGTISYTVSATPNADLDTLTLTDTLGDGQTLNKSSIKINYVTVPSKYYTYVNGVLNVDVAGFLESQGSSVTADTTYTVRYTVSVDDNAWGTELTNSAYWSWDGSASTQNEPDVTSITPYKNVTSKTMTTNTDGNGSVESFTYTITVGDGKTNLAGYTLTDTFSSSNQKLSGTITITPDVNGQTTISVNSTEDGFTYTFPSTGTYYGPYTIMYTTTFETTGLTGYTTVSNTVITTNPDDPTVKEEDSKSANVYTGNEKDEFTVTKEAGELDVTNNTISWTITVNIPSGTTIDRLWVYEYNSDYIKGTELDTGTVLATLGVDWDSITVTVNGTARDGYDSVVNPVDFNGGVDFSSLESKYYYLYSQTWYGTDPTYILIPEATGKVVITLKTKISNCTGTDWKDSTAGVEFYNQVLVSQTNWDLSKLATATYTYTREYQLSKTSSYDADTGITTWKVNVNKSQLVYDPDIEASIYDIIPEGMEYVSGSFTYSVNGDSSTTATVTTGTTEVISGSGTVDCETISATLGYLSGNYYHCEYQTKITGDDVITDDGSSTYTNAVDLKNGDTVLASTASTVTITPKYLTKDSATSNTSIGDTDTDDLITYTIVVNPGALKLSDEDSLTLTDTLPSGMELAIEVLDNKTKTVTFTDENGEDVLGCSFTYSDKVLTVIVPDETYVKVTFVVKVTELGSQTFTNTATLTLSGSVTRSSSKTTYVEVLSHQATIQGAKNRVIVTKYDDTLISLVSGAEFTLYAVELDSDNVISNDSTVVGTTTTKSGEAIFSNLEYGKLYKIVETASATGYVTSNTEHYFAIYDSSTGATQTKDVVTAAMSAVSTANGGLTIEVSAGPYELLVTNRSTTDIKGSILVTKFIKADGQTDEDATGSFKVAIYDSQYVAGSNLTPVQTKTIVVSADGTASVSFSDLDLDTTYYVYELNDDDEPILDGGSYRSYTVTYVNQSIAISDRNTTGSVTINNDVVATAEIQVKKSYSGTTDWIED
ncbi:MAG: hypothetical protein LUI14_10105, partial [Lachnospiraceae bacterium]|nr:hypothetical protein [Lachnospiraceae bacterium]